MNAQPVAPVALPPRSRPAQPLVAPRDIAALAGLALAGGDHLCSRPLLLALVDLACAGRTEFGDAADWRALEAAVGRTGLAIDQIFDCLAREAVAPRAPAARKFRIFPFDYESWQAFRQRPDKADSSDEACWFDLCRSATGANPSDGDAAFVAFVRDAVRITRLPIDSVLDAASAADGGGSGRPGRAPDRAFHRFWLDGDHWEQTRRLAPDLDPPQTFLCACSWGYGRQWALAHLAPDLPGSTTAGAALPKDWRERIEAFRSDPKLQIGVALERLDRLLEASHRDEAQALAAYAAGAEFEPAGGAGKIAQLIGAVEAGLNLSLADVGPQIERLESRLRSNLDSWTPDAVARAIALLADLDARLGDGEDPVSQEGNHRGRLDQLLLQYAELRRDLDDDIRTGIIDLDQPRCPNFGELSLDEVDALLGRLESALPAVADAAAGQGPADLVGVEADLRQLRSLEARVIFGDESFDETKALRGRINALDGDRNRRRGLALRALERGDLNDLPSPRAG